MYKPSRFNYWVEDSHGDLLLYNSLYGCLAKVTKENKTQTIELMSLPTINPDHANAYVLKQKGFLIEDMDDEESKLRLLQAYAVGGNDLSLTVLPTEQCNFRCRYCYEDFKRGKMSEATQQALIKYVNKNICNYSSLDVGWFGGEPMVAFDVIETLSRRFIEICKKARRVYRASMVTNGYLLDAEHFKKLLSYNVTRYMITIDGLKNTQDFQKPLANGQGTFDTVINNLKEIKESVKTGTFKITIRTNFTQEIYQQIDEYIDYFYDTFGDDKRFEFFIRPAGDWGGERVKAFTGTFINDNISQVYERFISSDKRLPFNIYYDFLSPMGTVCYAARRNSFIIDSDGNIRKCSCDLDDDNENNIGKLMDNGSMEIQSDKLAQWICNFEKDEQCDNCFFLPSCLKNNCPGKKIIHKNSNRICPYEKKNIAATLRLLSSSDNFEVLF